MERGFACENCREEDSTLVTTDGEIVALLCDDCFEEVKRETEPQRREYDPAYEIRVVAEG